MIRDHQKHLIFNNSSVHDALAKLNELAEDAILFVISEDKRLIGSLTDGDIRRGLLNGLSIEGDVESFSQKSPKFFEKDNHDIQQVIEYRNKNFKIVPVLDKEGRLINIVNFRLIKSYLPIDVVIMAGGRGERLRPLTDELPKPLLPVGDKPIIEHNIDRLSSFGVDDFWISIKYLGEKIQNYFGNGNRKGLNVRYINETQPLGTIGALSLVNDFMHEHVLITNSDILTNLNYEQFYLDFINSGADFSVVTIPYNVDIPYAILETDDKQIKNFTEKPTYTYFANAGIYLIKKELLKKIPENSFYNATDLLENLIKNGHNVISYPLRGYWLDVGKPDDYKKAQQDINFIAF